MGKVNCTSCIHLKTKMVHDYKELIKIRNRCFKASGLDEKIKISPVVMKKLKEENKAQIVWCAKGQLKYIFWFSDRLEEYDALNRECPFYEEA